MFKIKKTLIISLAFLLLTGCGSPSTSNSSKSESSQNSSSSSTIKSSSSEASTSSSSNAETKSSGSIILATTTSTSDSGLLDYLLPEFTKDTGIEVKTVSVGTGKAIQMGKDGEADVLLVHDKTSEEQFMSEEYGISRHDVMYNDFILVGSEEDPAGIKSSSSSDIIGSLKLISEKQSKFISRSDDSGTHKLELRLWKDAGITPSGDWYVEAGAGMGDVLKMANELKGYTISDRATYLSLKDTLDLTILCEKDDKLFNQYGVLVVNPDKLNLGDKLNVEGAKKFSDWIISEKVQKLIGEYGMDKYGQALFVPNAK